MDFKVVDQYEKYGRKIVIVHVTPEGKERTYLKPYYCGYVQLVNKPSYPDWDYFEERYPAPGGISYADDLERYGIEGYFIGFDTCHAFMELYTHEEARKDCEDLAKQLNKKGEF